MHIPLLTLLLWFLRLLVLLSILLEGSLLALKFWRKTFFNSEQNSLQKVFAPFPESGNDGFATFMHDWAERQGK